MNKDKLIEIIPLLLENGIIKTNSEFRRLVDQGGVKINGEKIDDLNRVLVSGDVLKIGKKKFIKIIN